jgi:transmembrane sensor
LKENDLGTIDPIHYRKTDDGDYDRIEYLLANGEDSNELRHLLEKEWDAHLNDPSLTDTDVKHLLGSIHHSIRKMEYQNNQTFFQTFSKVYRRIAAVLLIPLIIGGGAVISHLNKEKPQIADQPVVSTISAPLGSRVAFNLPDGTKGMLNSGSSLSYSIPFSNNRKVSLNGEAWFEVIRDENHIFEINIENSSVRVLGTSFNVSAYPAEDYVEIVLQNGKVEFLDHANERNLTMLPSERLVFQHGNITKSLTDPAKYLAWTKGRMVFSNDPMAEVARRIERWYNVKVILADKELEKYSFRGTFEDDKLEDVFRLLAMTSPIKYKITPRTLLPEGSYEKEIVTVSLKKL